tara:strand:- start:918 stop:1415 length:498 start_codon:yes stop_codon:yes gene_type:complete
MTFGIMARKLHNVALYVLNLMGVGKSLIILLTSIALVGCGTTNELVYNSHSTYGSTNSDYSSTGSVFNIASNYYKWNVGRMNKYDRKQQEQAVFYALNRLAPGETTEWFNGNTGAHGYVQVASTYPQGSGYCKIIYSQLVYKGQERTFSETACINAVDNSWRFVR